MKYTARDPQNQNTKYTSGEGSRLACDLKIIVYLLYDYEKYIHIYPGGTLLQKIFKD